MDYEAMGRRIRQQRKLMKMTQGELGAAVNVSASYIGHIERGLKHCTLDTVVELCRVLKVTPNFLLQDAFDPDLDIAPQTLSENSRSMLGAIANVLREHDII